MIIDENFKGLIDTGNGYYKYEGDIITKENLEIKIELFCTGKVEAGGWIEAGGSIKAGKWIEAGESIGAGESIEAGEWIEAGKWIKAREWIEAGESIEAGKWIEAGEWIEAGGSIEAGEWIGAGGWIKAGEWIKFYGIKTSKVLCVSGLIYKIQVIDTHIKIGYQLYKKETWKNFTDREIISMEGKKALEFWNENKEWILKM